MPLTPERFSSWKHQEESKAVFKEMREAREEFLHCLLSGTATKVLNNDEQSHDYMMLLVGIIYGIDLLLEMRFDNEQ